MEFKLLIAAAVLFIISRFVKGRKKRFGGLFGKIYNEVFEWLETGWSAVLLASIIMYFILQAFKIPTGSMRMTFLEGDHLFVNKFIYGFRVPFTGGRRILPIREIRRGDIIVFAAPDRALSLDERERGIRKDFIKRCVALGGDTVEIREKVLYVNGVAQDEHYIQHVDKYIYPLSLGIISPREDHQKAWEQGSFAGSLVSIRDNFGPVVVPPGNYFVLGDNRDRSFDSRFWGPLPDNYIKGTSWFIYWPPSRIMLTGR